MPLMALAMRRANRKDLWCLKEILEASAVSSGSPISEPSP
jgi:hypothetical protein